MLDLYEGASSEKEKNQMFSYLKKISKAFSATIEHLNEIVKSQNQADINPVQKNLHENVKDSIENLRIQITSSDAIVKNKEGKGVNLLVNPAYMESILLNFLTNAIKYRHPDRPPVVELDSFYENDKIALRIKDNRKGINLKKHGADLFGMYKTFHGNPDAQGIGLYITKYQVEAMGGEIKVESKENIGTTFIIFFESCIN
jgi:K+-sensing histidine kinase KdpD